ncbi:hypothetical protein ADK52_19995 [Streptomyces sp. WM6372]|nr:hypothetical protein ADK52_19995 [Streptomyces sp. WM6372]
MEQFKSTLYRANGSRRSSGYAAAQGDEARAEFPGVLRVLDLLPSMTGAVHGGLDRFGVGGLVAGEAGAGCLHPQPAAAHRIAGEVGEVGPDLQPVDGLRRLRTLGVQSPSLPPRGE